jgi:hypothetical protein
MDPITSTLIGRTSAIVATIVLALAASLVDTESASATVKTKPLALVITATVGDIKYKMMTITNTGSGTETISGGYSTLSEFGTPTWGGTRSGTYAYVIPAYTSCTVQWGFKPTATGPVTTIGNITFKSGATLYIFLNGIGTY